MKRKVLIAHVLQMSPPFPSLKKLLDGFTNLNNIIISFLNVIRIIKFADKITDDVDFTESSSFKTVVTRMDPRKSRHGFFLWLIHQV